MLNKVLLGLSLLTYISSPVGVFHAPTGLSVKMANLNTPGYSNVLDDLEKLQIENLFSYKNGLESKSKVLALVEDEEGYVYLYVYRNSISNIYDLVDISTRSDKGSEDFKEDYKRYNLVEISSDNYLVKYRVQGLKADFKTNRRYAIRQVYYSKTANVISEIVGVSLEYLIARDNEGKWVTQTNTIDSVELEGKTFFSLSYDRYERSNADGIFGNSYGHYFFRQRYYRVFNTSYSLDDILRIDLNYSSQYFSGVTNIGYSYTDLNGDRLVNNLTSKDRFQSNIQSTGIQDSTITIVPETVNYTTVKPWFFKKTSYSYNTIQKTNSIKNITDELKQYEWLVTFSDLEVEGFRSVLDPINQYWYVKDYKEVYQTSIMTMYAQKNGELKELTVIDSYDDSSGNQPVEEEKAKNFWQKIIDAFNNVFNGNGDFLDYVIVIITCLLALIALGVLVTIIRFLKVIFSLFIK